MSSCQSRMSSCQCADRLVAARVSRPRQHILILVCTSVLIRVLSQRTNGNRGLVSIWDFAARCETRICYEIISQIFENSAPAPAQPQARSARPPFRSLRSRLLSLVFSAGPHILTEPGVCVCVCVSQHCLIHELSSRDDERTKLSMHDSLVGCCGGMYGVGAGAIEPEL